MIVQSRIALHILLCYNENADKQQRLSRKHAAGHRSPGTPSVGLPLHYGHAAAAKRMTVHICFLSEITASAVIFFAFRQQEQTTFPETSGQPAGKQHTSEKSFHPQSRFNQNRRRLKKSAPQLIEKGIRFADAIEEWGPLSQVPKPAELLKAGEFRSLRRATRALPSTRELFEKSSTKNFYFGFSVSLSPV